MHSPLLPDVTAASPQHADLCKLVRLVFTTVLDHDDGNFRAGNVRAESTRRRQVKRRRQLRFQVHGGG